MNADVVINGPLWMNSIFTNVSELNDVLIGLLSTIFELHPNLKGLLNIYHEPQMKFLEEQYEKLDKKPKVQISFIFVNIWGGVLTSLLFWSTFFAKSIISAA